MKEDVKKKVVFPTAVCAQREHIDKALVPKVSSIAAHRISLWSETEYWEAYQMY